MGGAMNLVRATFTGENVTIRVLTRYDKLAANYLASSSHQSESGCALMPGVLFNAS
jgi:hypothetical protein